MCFAPRKAGTPEAYPTFFNRLPVVGQLENAGLFSFNRKPKASASETRFVTFSRSPLACG